MNGLFADGGVILKNPSTIGGTWAYCLVDCEGQYVQQKSGILLPAQIKMSHVTNNVTELFALVKGILSLPEDWEGMVYSDSHVSLLRIFRYGKLNNVPDCFMDGIKRARE